MIIKPVLTEKTMSEAKKGFYTFLVGRNTDKYHAKVMVQDVYGVHVTHVRTITIKGGKRKNFRGQIVRNASVKKAIVTLKKDEKIDIFEEKKGKQS